MAASPAAVRAWARANGMDVGERVGCRRRSPMPTAAETVQVALRTGLID